MEQDAGRPITRLRVDGGATANGLLMQMQADLLGVDIIRPAMVEATALGAGRLAAQGLGLASDRAKQPDSGASIFHPRMAPDERERSLARWRDALARA
jgi:glycerol kinase